MEDKRILVIDDDPDVRRMLVLVLRAVSSHIEEAASAEQAASRIAAAAYDAVVLDWNLREGSGAAFLEKLAEDNPSAFARTLVITGDLSAGRGSHPAERLGRPVLAKPFRPPALLSLLERLPC
jgi:CheY-like chemotaxis protein